MTISIHAPRVGGDAPFWSTASSSTFQSTPPVWGATVDGEIQKIVRHLFQSTPPVWGATCPVSASGSNQQYFNPRPPCGGRLQYPPAVY